MIGFDLVIAGGSFGFLGSLVLAKSFLKPSFQRQATQSYFGQNPFLARNQIVQRVEAFVGTTWLVLAFVCGSLGTVINETEGSSNGHSQHWNHFLVILVFTGILLWVSLSYAKRKSKAEYIPLMLYLQREAYQQCVRYLLTGGLEESELQRTDITQGIKDQRLMSVTGRLDAIGQLIDMPRMPLETDRNYVQRMKLLFDAAQ